MVLKQPQQFLYASDGLLDGGLHCCTVDLVREGDCVDYFPERDELIVFKDLINYEVQELDNSRGMPYKLVDSC